MLSRSAKFPSVKQLFTLDCCSFGRVFFLFFSLDCFYRSRTLGWVAIAVTGGFLHSWECYRGMRLWECICGRLKLCIRESSAPCSLDSFCVQAFLQSLAGSGMGSQQWYGEGCSVGSIESGVFCRFVPLDGSLSAVVGEIWIPCRFCAMCSVCTICLSCLSGPLINI